MNLQYSFIIFEMSIGQGELPKAKSIRGFGTSYTLKSNVESHKKLRIFVFKIYRPRTFLSLQYKMFSEISISTTAQPMGGCYC